MANKYLDQAGVQYLWSKIKAEDDKTLLAANKHVNDLWGLTDDENAVVDKIKEVLKVFEDYEEGKNLLEFINNKLDKSGGTITGDLTVTQDIRADHVATGSFEADGQVLLGGSRIEHDGGGYYFDLPKKDGTAALTSDIPTNYVTTDTVQTITGAKTFKTDITSTASIIFNKQNSAVIEMYDALEQKYLDVLWFDDDHGFDTHGMINFGSGESKIVLNSKVKPAWANSSGTLSDMALVSDLAIALTTAEIDKAIE